MVRASFAFSILALASLACGSAETDDPGATDDDLVAKPKIRLVVTVDWEGRDLTDENQRAMQDLHTRFPQVKIVQFLNANYYFKPGADRADVTHRIASVLGPGDERALHIHGWKRLFEASGTTFKSGPTFWGTALAPSECTFDCGHEVPISEYPTEELRKAVKLSLDTLQSNGFGRPTSFRTGGWMARQNVRDAIRAEGITVDQSAVPTVFLQPQLGRYPVYGWLSDLWQGTTNISQPSKLPTASGDLAEIPDNGCLADYMSAQQMVDVYEANKAEFLRGNRKKSVVVSIGFHQETAARYLPALEDALGRIFDEAKRENIPIESMTSAAALK